MKITKIMAIATLASTVSMTAIAAGADNPARYTGAEGNSPEASSSAYGQQGQMPMMQGGQGRMPMMCGQQGQMPMMQDGQGQMPMMYGQQGQMPMMQGQQGQMPMMQMMQQRHAMMDGHMKHMEARMARIEALLQQLVELQKK